jgi:hypothetical protein
MAYIGASYVIRKRFITHVSKLRTGKHHSQELQWDWKRLGEECFLFRVMEWYCGDLSDCIAEGRFLKERERLAIEQTRSVYNKYCVPGYRSPRERLRPDLYRKPNGPE